VRSVVLPRGHWQRQIARLDPEVDFEQIARITALHEFPWDSQQALSLALFRTYAVPSIGRLLHETGQLTGAAQRRHDDTVIILEAIAERGMESPDGRAGVRRMNQMHGSHDISNDDMRYVLSTFVVTPVRWVERYGWRAGSDAERIAAVRYHQRLGRLMGITGIPDDYQFVTFYPPPLRRVMRQVSIALLDDHLREAFGYPRPPAPLVRLAHGSLVARGRLVRLLPARRQPRLLRDTHRVRSYPGGFVIDRLGTFPASAGSDDLPPEV
jgi:hypothetical protein